MSRQAPLTSLVLAATLLLGPPGAGAQEAAEPRITAVAIGDMSLEANPELEGVAAAMIGGAFDEPGAFAAHSLMRAGAEFPPHSHPEQRITVVLEGTMYLGEGTVVDPALERAYPAGTAAVTPAGVPHWMVSRDGDVRLLEIGAGPTTTDFAAEGG